MKPFTSSIHLPSGLLSPHHNHIVRRLSSMRGQYLDEKAFQFMLEREDALIYEVYENNLPEVAGELQHGISIVRPGKVGDEFYMTKGHFHKVLDTAEVYYCINGHGYMVMETPEGEWAVEELVPSCVLYVPPFWAHRSVNVGNDNLIQLFVYPGHAGHDYGAIETHGFRKLILEQGGKVAIVDNPRWLGK